MTDDRTSWFDEYPVYTFNEYSRYLRKRYGETVFRVSVDAGFTCPHREKSPDYRGCSFCEEKGARAPYLASVENLKLQIAKSIGFLKSRYKARKYILYFQAFSNTYAPVERLRAVYDQGLSVADFLELVVSTRPDCIDEEKTDLLRSYSNRGYTVWIELGLQSVSGITLERIKRGHTLGDFEKAYKILKSRSLNVSVHVIFGLPGEGTDEIMRTMEYLAGLRPDGVKIHNLHIPKGTGLADEFVAGELVAPGKDRHLVYTEHALEILPKNTLIMRLTCDTHHDLLLSPRYFCNKSEFLSSLKSRMRISNTWQGKKYNS
jgi:radical SAM protein (TIGR01212 family)